MVLQDFTPYYTCTIWSGYVDKHQRSPDTGNYRTYSSRDLWNRDYETGFMKKSCKDKDFEQAGYCSVKQLSGQRHRDASKLTIVRLSTRTDLIQPNFQPSAVPNTAGGGSSRSHNSYSSRNSPTVMRIYEDDVRRA